MTIGDVVWPALYVSQELWKFWYLIIGTVVLETFTIRYILNFSFLKSLWISVFGNLMSGFIGTIVMTLGMLPWHLIVDNLVPDATFDIRNWIATFILMCFGSVIIESIFVRIIIKQSFRKIFKAMVWGNLLSYTFIAYILFTKTDKNPDEAKIKYTYFLPNKRAFTLLNKSYMRLDTAFASISLDKNGDILNDRKGYGYNLTVPFAKSDSGSFVFSLDIKDKSKGRGSSGTNEHFVEIDLRNLDDTIEIVLEQKNPDSNIGWQSPIVTDTINLVRIK